MNANIEFSSSALNDWVDIFRAGQHVDSSGKSRFFSINDLDEIIKNHPEGGAPAVIGHPKIDDPAYGWTEALKRIGDVLQAKFTKLNPLFVQAVTSGAYKNRSVSLIKDSQVGWRLRHVGWLGAQPPAIEGLRPANFNGGDLFYEFNFNDGEVNMEGKTYTQADLDQAAKAAADKAKAEALAEAEKAKQAEFAQGAKFTQADIDMAVKAAADKAKAEADSKKAAGVDQAQFSALQAELHAEKTARQKDKINQQINEWQRDGYILPAEKTGMAEFMQGLQPQTFEFAAADGKTEKQNAEVWFSQFIKGRGALIKTGAVKMGDEPTPEQTTATLSSQISEFVDDKKAKGIVVSYAEAAAAVQKQPPATK